MEHLGDLSVCVDCILYLANGDEPEGEEAAEVIKRALMWKMAEGITVVACGDELGFSWSACELCGSRLGGGRYKAAELGSAASGARPS